MQFIRILTFGVLMSMPLFSITQPVKGKGYSKIYENLYVFRNLVNGYDTFQVNYYYTHHKLLEACMTKKINQGFVKNMGYEYVESFAKFFNILFQDTFQFSLPDSSDLIYAYKKGLIKIDKNCPCELTKQGVINLKYPGKPCKDYAFRLVAYFVKKEDVVE